MEKRLRRDLKRTHALLADVQLLLETSGPDLVPPGAKEDLEKLRGQVRRRGTPWLGLKRGALSGDLLPRTPVGPSL